MGAAAVGGLIGKALGAGGSSSLPPPQTTVTVMPGASGYPAPVYAAGPGGYMLPPPAGYYPPAGYPGAPPPAPPAAAPGGAGYPGSAWHGAPAAPSAPPAPHYAPPAPHYAPPPYAHGGGDVPEKVGGTGGGGAGAPLGNPPQGFKWAAMEPFQWSLTPAFPGQRAGSQTPDGAPLYTMLHLVPAA
jgi:hypothetical protein